MKTCFFVKQISLSGCAFRKFLSCMRKSRGNNLIGKKLLFFSKNTKAEAKVLILSLVGVSSTQRYEKYLGFPTLIGRYKVSALTSIKGGI
jgi:hypothetical protein